MVVDVVGSKTQNGITMGYGGVLFGAVSLKSHTVLVVFPTVNFHQQLANLQVKAVAGDENIVLGVDSFCAQLPA